LTFWPKISTVPGQTPKVLGEEQSWSEAGVSEVESLSKLTVQTRLPQGSGQKGMSYNKVFLNKRRVW